jgi:chromosome segregation ATPase
LEDASRKFIQFDMNRFQVDMNRELESHISKLNTEYKFHANSVVQRLEASEDANERSLQIKDTMILWRSQKQQAIAEVARQNTAYQERFAQVNEQKHGMRTKLAEVEGKLRELQREIAMTNLENQGLKALISGEQELKQERNTEEAHALNLVNEDLKQGIVFTEEEAAKVQRQRDYAQQAVQALEGVVVESKTRA